MTVTPSHHPSSLDSAPSGMRDELTGLVTQNLLMDRVGQSLERAQRTAATDAVVVVALEHFDSITESFGHRLADDAIAEIGQRLVGLLRSADTVARLDGTLFALHFENTDSHAAGLLASRVREEIARPVVVAATEFVLDSSIGIALNRDGDDEGPYGLLRHAHVAMLRAKSDSTRSVAFFEQQMQDAVELETRMVAALRTAISRCGLELVYLPILDLSASKIVGAEALVRWSSPEFGDVSPSKFLALAERSGLSIELDRWAVGEACAAAVAWPEDLLLSVNLSHRHLLQGDVAFWLSKTLQASGLEASRLVVEFSETAAMSDRPETIDRLDDLKRLGVRVAVDDFGAGRSSLANMYNYPVDIVKIDPMFIRVAGDSSRARNVTRALIDLAYALGMTVVAEGIETEDEMATLQRMGCAFGQGFVISRPVSAAGFAELLGAEQLARGDNRAA
jgi:diguanylate cyclase (GGDEF)-like protein